MEEDFLISTGMMRKQFVQEVILGRATYSPPLDSLAGTLWIIISISISISISSRISSIIISVIIIIVIMINVIIIIIIIIIEGAEVTCAGRYRSGGSKNDPDSPRIAAGAAHDGAQHWSQQYT